MFSEEKGIGNDDDKVVTLVFVVMAFLFLVIIIRIINDFTMGSGCCNCCCGYRFCW
jgi:hypothetical protein